MHYLNVKSLYGIVSIMFKKSKLNRFYGTGKLKVLISLCFMNVICYP